MTRTSPHWHEKFMLPFLISRKIFQKMRKKSKILNFLLYPESAFIFLKELKRIDFIWGLFFLKKEHSFEFWLYLANIFVPRNKFFEFYLQTFETGDAMICLIT